MLLESTQRLLITLLHLTATWYEKALWDWLEILAIPLLLLFLGYRLQVAEQKRVAQQEELEEERVAQQEELEKEIAEDNLRDEALQAYFDRMSELLLDRGLSSSKPDDPVRDVAKTRTLTVLRRMGIDAERKASILYFLFDTGLVKCTYSKDTSETVINLKGADLRGANLSGADLDRVNLSGVNLSGANLSKAKLKCVNLNSANLSDVDLRDATLGIQTDLSVTWLSYVDQSGKIWTRADLRNAKNLTAKQIKVAQNWQNARYNPEFRKELGLPPETESTESSS